MPLVDVHWHHVPEAFVAALENPNNPWGERMVRRDDGRLDWLAPDGRPRFRDVMERLYRPELQVAELDRRGVDVAAVSPPPMLFYDWEDPAKALDMHQMINDQFAALAARYPGRFAPLAAVPLQDPTRAIHELERAMGKGLAGAEICTNIAGRNLDEPDFLPFFQRAAELGAFVFVHPSNVIGQDRLRRYYLTNLIGNPTDTCVAIASLIFGGVYEQAPGLTCCFAHGGGSFPMLLGRLEHGYRVRTEATRSPREHLPLLYCDTLTHDDRARRLLIDTLGAGHVLVGSDLPFDMGDEEPVKTVRSTPGLGEAEQEQILGETATRLLRLNR